MALVRLATSGSIGWYKAWTLGEWFSPDPVQLFELFCVNAVPLGDFGRSKGPFRWVNSLAHRLRDNAPRNARKNIAAHYDLGNDFYSSWLDPTMTYSSARFADDADSLEHAQLCKIRKLLDRLDLKPGQRLLEIGCGWGTLAIEAAKRGANVVGLTLSTEQKAWAERKIAEKGLPDTSKFAFRTIARLPSSSTRWRRSRWWKRSVSAGGAPISTASRAISSLAAEQRFSSSACGTNCSTDTCATPTSSRPTSSRAAASSTSRSSKRIASERGLSWQDQECFRLDYAETLERWRDRYNEAVARGALKVSPSRSTTSGVIISCIARAAFGAGRSTSRR